MVPFRTEDARFFHGRDEEIRQLLTLIRQHHFLAVVGSSGSGKSSLVTAGLLPKLDDPRNFPRGTWCVLTMRPGATPIEELASALHGVPSDPGAVISAALAVESRAQRLLLFVDQFEELFSQVKDATTRDAFIGCLKALRADPRCTVILTMRADFYGDLMNSALWPIDKSQVLEVAALRGEALRQAIVKPAEAAGVYLEEGLVERLLADAANEPGSLPMLQEALVLLWGTMSGRLLTRASYDTLGRDGRSGLAVAMATKADATLAALPPDRQRIARRIFLRLIQFGEGRPDTRRQLGVDDLRARTDEPRAFDDVLQVLIANRLLTPSIDEARGLRVDISHEMLIAGWPASREWVQARRDAEKIRRRLAVKAEEWARLGRSEGGLLDAAELSEADRWLATPDAADLGIDSDVQALAAASREAIEREAREREAARRRELQAVRDLAAARGQRIKVLYGSGAVLSLLLGGLAALTYYANRARSRADENAARVSVVAGALALQNRAPIEAIHYFARALADLPGSSPTGTLIRQHLGLLARGQLQIDSILELPGRIDSASFNRDGTRVVTTSEAGEAHVWNVATGAILAVLKVPTPSGSDLTAGPSEATGPAPEGHRPEIAFAQFCRDGARIITLSGDRLRARVWVVGSDRPPVLIEEPGMSFVPFRVVEGGYSIPAFSPDASRVVVLSGDRAARVLRVEPGREPATLYTLGEHPAPVAYAEFSPDGSRILTLTKDHFARFWNAANGRPLGSALRFDAGLKFEFSPDGSRFASYETTKGVRIWKTDNMGEPAIRLQADRIDLSGFAFSPDNSRILTFGRGWVARIWRTDDGRLVTGLPRAPHGALGDAREQARPISAAAFSPDGRLVATIDDHGATRVWRARNGQFQELQGDAGPEASISFQEHGLRVLVRTLGSVRVARAAIPGHVVFLEGPERRTSIFTATFSPDGKQIVSAWADGTARISDAATGRTTREIPAHPDGAAVTCAEFSREGSRIVTAGLFGRAMVWPLKGNASPLVLKGHDPTMTIWNVTFSPDGSRILTASKDKTARIWVAGDGRRLMVLTGHASVVNCANFSPEGDRVVTASGDGTAGIYLVPTRPGGDGQAVGEPTKLAASFVLSEKISSDSSKSEADTMFTAVFSADGARVVTAAQSGAIRIWDARDGRLLSEFKRAGGGALSASFSGDGKQIIAACDDGSARIWRAEDGRLLNVLQGHQAKVYDSTSFLPSPSVTLSPRTAMAKPAIGREEERPRQGGCGDTIPNSRFSASGCGGSGASA